MSVYICCSPLITCHSLLYEVVCDTLRFLLQSRVRDCCICQDRLVVTIYEGRLIAGYPHHSEFVSKTANVLTALFHCDKSEPKDEEDEDSMLACFLLHQYTNALLIYTRKPVLKHRVTITSCYRLKFIRSLHYSQIINRPYCILQQLQYDLWWKMFRWVRNLV